MLRTMKVMQVGALCAVLAAPAGVFAQQGSTSADAKSIEKTLHRDNTEQIRLGMLGQAKAESDDVAEFGRELTEDHQKADLQVLEFARDKKLSLAPDAGHGTSGLEPAQGTSDSLKKLSALSGAEFDREYLKMLTSWHENELRKLQATEAKVTDSEAKGLVTDMISTVENHQKKLASLGQEAAKAKPERREVTPSNDANLKALVPELHRANREEVRLGKLAIVKAKSDDVADFAKSMVNDHTSADMSLMALTRDKELGFTPEDSSAQLPTKGTTGRPESVVRLGKLSGAEFDRAYMKLMVSRHDETLRKLQSAQQRVTDEDGQKLLKSLASTVEDHRDQAQKIAQSLNEKKQEHSSSSTGLPGSSASR